MRRSSPITILSVVLVLVLWFFCVDPLAHDEYEMVQSPMINLVRFQSEAKAETKWQCGDDQSQW